LVLAHLQMAKTNKKILIADDDPIYRDIAAETLSSKGHIVTLAADGGEAIALLEATQFDAAIIDLTMPVADGVTVIETLRKGGLNATIPVIVITGHDDAVAVERAYLAGATSFLTKPLNWILFTPHVEFVLRSGETEAELREASATAAFLSNLKSQMMSALAQEFQTPLKTILSFSQLIQKEVYGAISPPAYGEMLQDIDKSARSLNVALLKVMNYGQSLTQHLQIRSEPLNARNTITDVIEAFETQAQRRGIFIKPSITVAPETKLFADGALLSQALRSVLDNAVRLSPRGAIVDVRASIDDSGALSMVVSDDGPALAQDLLHEVNGRPAAPRMTAPITQTTDVSIRIAKILTEAHQGKMTLSSDPVLGNEVHISIPLGSAPKAEASNSPAPPTDALQRLARISAELSADPRFRDKPGATHFQNRNVNAPMLKLG
jgi:CheY-like chemotaxis protein